MFFEVFLIALLAGISPGPDFFLVMKNSLGYGRRIGIASALGIATALIVHSSYTILGLAIIIQNYHTIFQIIQISGAGYLAYLGISSIISTFSESKLELAVTGELSECKSFFYGFKNGFLCNILNPKAFVFFLSVFSQFMSPESLSWTKWIYGLEVVLVIGLWFVLLSVVISSRIFRNLYKKSHKWFERLFGGILIFFAYRICKSALTK